MSETPWVIRHWRIVTLMDLIEGRAQIFWTTAAMAGQAIVHLEVGRFVDDNAGHVGGALGLLQREAERLEMTSSARQCQRIKDYIDKSEPTQGQFREMLIELLRRTGDDLLDQYFLAVPSRYVELYKQTKPPFEKETTDAFPLATEDISEAAKCLAMNRSTATVFHLMRAMECAVQKLAAKLNIPNTERVWGNLLSDMRTKIEPMPKGPDRTKWSEVHSHLYHVKEAWRNDTMHPKQTYTFDEAKAIFDAVKVFMNGLSALV